MPLYDYACRCGRVTESREAMDVVLIRCKCGGMASRQGVYREQYISCETGPRGGLKVEPPKDEKDLRKPFAEYREASQELDYAYSRVDDPKVKPPNYYKTGLKEAKKRGAKIRA